MSEEESKKSNQYQISSQIGKGSFGSVYRATTPEGDPVAIKRVFQDKRYKNRELQIMQQLHHPNIVQLKNHFFTTGATQSQVFLNLIMDFVPDTLFKIMKQYYSESHAIPMILVKLYSYQMFRSLAQCHALNICHRDIKPQNLLVNSQTHILKLCDFGSAKKLVVGQNNVAYICSRFYRAPELIFGANQYSNAVDIWSAACVTAELMLNRPLFPGESNADQLIQIIKLLGTPTIEEIRAMNPYYTEYQFPYVKSTPMFRIFQYGVSEDAISFLNSLLKYNPEERPSALQALTHHFFDDLRVSGVILHDGRPLPELFNWTQEEIGSEGPEVISKLTPEFARQYKWVLKKFYVMEFFIGR